MTAYSVLDLVKDGLEEGCVGVFYKPLNLDKVIEFVGNVGKGCLTLVIDGDSNTCDGIKGVLEEKNHTVSCAKNGGDAIMIARDEPIDIAFIQVKMPVLDGLETFLALKTANPGITAIMMADNRDEDKDLIEEAIKNGARKCLYKPLDMGELISIVDKTYKGEKG